MATETSARIEAKDALHSLIQAAISDAQTAWGHPGPSKIQRETVFVGNIEPHGQEANKLGDVTRSEQFVIEVVVNVMKRGSQRDASVRCAALADQVEQQVRENRQLGLTDKIKLAEVVSMPLREGIAGDKGRVAEIVMKVQVTTRLRRT